MSGRAWTPAERAEQAERMSGLVRRLWLDPTYRERAVARLTRWRRLIQEPPSVLDRLFSRIEPEPSSGCWLWIGMAYKRGYGFAFWQGRREYVHRIMFTLIVGPIPLDHDLHHKCRVRSCCNPQHLEPMDAGAHSRLTQLERRQRKESQSTLPTPRASAQ